MGPSVLFLDEQEILDHAMKQFTLCESAGVRARKWGATSMVTYANALAVPRTDPLAAKDNPQLLQPFVCRCRLASAGLGGGRIDNLVCDTIAGRKKPNILLLPQHRALQKKIVAVLRNRFIMQRFRLRNRFI